ncbi:hypothetical protein NDU88_005693 [Pleurodeles waltl]|uniref:Uncharacterized protein n=1 Tax=Pleurodeles waltl TaxID=8319 RepID=A0AAV7N1A3_PLEWA|nr:hypothetical protein NDU88_005693 [Pleurodeles waltl]
MDSFLLGLCAKEGAPLCFRTKDGSLVRCSTRDSNLLFGSRALHRFPASDSAQGASRGLETHWCNSASEAAPGSDPAAGSSLLPAQRKSSDQTARSPQSLFGSSKQVAGCSRVQHKGSRHGQLPVEILQQYRRLFSDRSQKPGISLGHSSREGPTLRSNTRGQPRAHQRTSPCPALSTRGQLPGLSISSTQRRHSSRCIVGMFPPTASQPPSQLGPVKGTGAHRRCHPVMLSQSFTVQGRLKPWQCEEQQKAPK